MRRRTFLLLLTALSVSGCNNDTTATTPPTNAGATTGTPTEPGEPRKGTKVKIGFVVKSATEEWFQTEWKFAEQAAVKTGFDLIKLEATDAEKMLAALDNLSAQGVKGVIVCSPDVKLGPA